MNRARRLYERFGFVEVRTDEFKVYLERRIQKQAELASTIPYSNVSRRTIAAW